uniref:(California timema) hypothetical protein n=1 Tax=Timema californicum TaxID=61474 RepID=A0A7R9JAP9_TIMCA|nr:unnamed protein product [Timema californicum]
MTQLWLKTRGRRVERDQTHVLTLRSDISLVNMDNGVKVITARCPISPCVSLFPSCVYDRRNVFGAEDKSHIGHMKAVKQSVLDGTSKWSAKIAITGSCCSQQLVKTTTNNT